jgi:hypothetical protein
MKNKQYAKNIIFLLLFTIITIVLAWLAPRIPQNIAYHDFADKRTLLNVRFFVNSFSNIIFILVGYLGLYACFFPPSSTTFITKEERWPFVALFIGAILTGFGSFYYHLQPDNISLLADRLPMCIIAMAYFSIMLTERVNKKLGLILLIPLVLLGIACSIQWEYSELIQQGDLRLYGWSQFYPISMSILIISLFPPRYTGTYYITASLLWYALAKFGEFTDHSMYDITLHLISGHTVKHIAAAIVIYAIVCYLKHRKPWDKSLSV